MIQLDDLLEFYPDPDVPNIQEIISSKKEFRELASTPTEPPPTRPGMFFKHQELIGRLMIFLDRLFLFHRTGTGKTCAVIRAAEEFKRRFHEKKSNIRKTYIIVYGKTLKEEWKRQILCTCTSEEDGYMTDLVKKSKPGKQRRSNITTAIKVWYKIKTFGRFAKKFNKNTEGKTEAEINEYIIRKYSDCLIVVDEIHNLRTDPAAGLNETETKLIYKVLWRIFHRMKRSKVILASATPMINNAREIGPHFNLILPENQQIPVDFDYDRATLEDLEPYFRGRISYVRELETGAVPIFIGERIKVDDPMSKLRVGDKLIDPQTVVYATRMGDIQNDTYQKYMSGALRELIREEMKSDISRFYSIERKISNFVFPDGSFSRKKSFDKYIIKIDNTHFRAKPELERMLRDLDQLERLSCKFATAIRLCKEARGNCFVYSEFVEMGAVLLGLAFEAQGFERFDSASSVFVSEEVGMAPVPICEPPTQVTNRRITIPKKDRYALLLGKTTNAEVEAMMEVFNSPENAHGEYIKVMIGSPVSRDGINLANVISVHIISAAWHPSGTYQAISRAIRATSHVVLLEEKRQQIQQERDEALRQLSQRNLPPDERNRQIKEIHERYDPSKAKIFIEIYKHAAVAHDDTSTDVSFYILSEQKDVTIRRMERFMKQCAVDCHIHKQRNIRPTDVDYTPETDYDVRDYSCVSPLPEYEDTSTYDVYYADGEIKKAQDDIMSLFKQVFSIQREDLYSYLNMYRPRFIDFALENLIYQKVILYDRYGFPSYLQEEGSTLFLQRDFPVGQIRSSYAQSYYTSTLLIRRSTTLPEYLTELQMAQQQEIIAQIERTKPDDPVFNQLIGNLNLESQAQLLERCITLSYIEKVSLSQFPYIKGVLDRFRLVYYADISAPSAEIARRAQESANRGKSRGRKPREKDIPSTPRRELPSSPSPLVENNTEKVYLHTLYSQVYDRKSYNITSQLDRPTGRIRILKPSEGIGWRDTNPYEYTIYNAIIRSRNEDRRKELGTHKGIFGSVLSDNKFRIHYVKEDDSKARDLRTISRGKECTTWKKSDLIEILWQLRIPPPIKHPLFEEVELEKMDKEEEEAFRKERIEYLLREDSSRDRRSEFEKFSNERLEFYYRWYSSRENRESMCKRIFDYLSMKNLILGTRITD